MSVPKPTEQSINLVLGSVVLGVAAVLMLSFVLYLGAGPRPGLLPFLIALPGRFLFLSFHYAGLLVPVYLAVASGFVLANRVRTKTLIGLHLGLFPFFSLAIGLRLLLDPNARLSRGPALVAEALTPLGGAVSSLLATVVLVVLIVRFVRSVSVEVDSAQDELREADELDEAYTPGEARSADLAADPAADSTENDVAVEADSESSGMEPGDLHDALDELEAVEDGHSPFRDEGPILAPRIAELLRNQVGPPMSLVEDEEEAATEPGIRPDDELDLYKDDEPELDPDDESDDYEPELDLDDEPDLYEDDEPELDLDDTVAQTDEVPVFVFRRRESEDGRRFAIEQGALDEPDEQPVVREVSKPGPLKGRAAARSKQVPYSVPVDGLLEHYSDGGYWEIDEETRKAAEVLRVTLEEFQIQAEVTGIRKGPVITMFELLPAPGVKLAKITNLSDNIALRLAASSVRIVAPIPGKHAVGIEIPNKRRAIVSFGELLREENFTESDMAIPLAIGKDIPGDAQIIDLARTPHLLIAGATGSGKSVCVNSIICSILYRRAPNEVKLILIDPKIVELKFYNDIPHLLTPVITDPKRAFQALQWCIYEMERRYSLLDSLGVRDIRSFNAKVKKRKIATEHLPYIVVVVDEFADLMATSGKELESTLARLAAMSRAVGIHLVLATQRPSTDVITGLIKANIPSRIAFMVASKVDSRIIIDSMGAEKLLGRGDMLFTSAWDPFPFRIQGAFLSEDEVERVVEHVKTLGEPEYIDDEIFIEEDEDDLYRDELEDPLVEKAISIVVSANKASASYLQRRLKIGYNRAARLVEEMERLGIVGPQNGSKARDILHIPEHVG